MNDKSYRKNVGLIVLNTSRKLLLCRRKHEKTWQFPQGGIDQGETPAKAAYRELWEEVGIKKTQTRPITESIGWHSYELPPELRKRSRSLKSFIGQTQKWFMLECRSDPIINFSIDEHQEFDRYAWVSYWYPLTKIVSFKKPVYQSVLNEFAKTYVKLSND